VALSLVLSFWTSNGTVMQKGDNSRSGYTAVNMAVVQSNFGATASYGFE